MREETKRLPARQGQVSHVTVKGLRLRVFERFGPNDKPPLLICNGLGQAFEILFPLMEHLNDRRVIAFDAAGVGRSDVPRVPKSILQHTELVADLLEKLKVSKVDVLGISWGGSIAQQLAHAHPDRCRKLILAITSAGGIGSWYGAPVSLFEIFVPLRFTSKRYGNFIGPWMYGGEAIADPSLFHEYSKHSIAPTYQGYLAQVAAMCSWTSLPWLHKLRQETLIIAGIHDTLIPLANQLLLASRIPESELRIFDAGHLLMYSKRELISGYIRDFLL